MDSDLTDTQVGHPSRPMLPEPQQRSFGRSTSATALWGHLLQKNLPSPLLPQLPRGTANSAANPPLAPNDKLGTSMRMLLHDTQAILEKFSERVEKLTSGVDKAQQDISAVQRMFEHARENTMLETVGLVNRCQLEIQKSLGKPAQADEVEELRKTFVSVDRRLEALDKRFDVLHLLNQTQSQTLQAIQDQQMTLLSSLAPILPLLQSIPLHIDTAKFEIKDTIKDGTRAAYYARNTSRSRTTTSSSETLTAPQKRLSGILPMSSPASYTPSRKRRRVDLSDDMSRQENRLFGSQASSSLLSQLDQSQDLPPCSESPSGARLSSPFSQGRRPPPLAQRSSQRLAMPATSPLAPEQDRNLWTSPARAAQLASPATPRHPDRRPHTARSSLNDPEHSPHVPCDRPTSPQAQTPAQHEASVDLQLDPSEKHPAAPLTHPPAAPISMGTPQDTITSVLGERRSRTPATRPVSSPTKLELSLIQPTNTIKYISGLRGPGQDPAWGVDPLPPIQRGQMPTVDYLMVNERTTLYKPMSLKDRRARGLLTDVTMDQGKRYIVVDEEDEEDDELAE